jgi:hypothetical protein
MAEPSRLLKRERRVVQPPPEQRYEKPEYMKEIKEVFREEKEFISITNPFIDFPINPSWEYESISNKNIILKANERSPLYTIAGNGYIQRIHVAGSHKDIVFNLIFSERTPVEFSFKDAFDLGLIRGLGYIRILQYKPALKRFALEFIPNFPGIPFKNELKIFAINPTTEEQKIYYYEFTIIKVLKPT